MNPLLASIGNLPEWFELMDGYRGAEWDRASFLADQWSYHSEEITDAMWAERLHCAELLILEWRTQKLDATLANLAAGDEHFRPISSNRAA